MLPLGHTGTAYLISRIGKTEKDKIDWRELILLVICANIFDIDFFPLYFLGYPGALHHYFPFHTPLVGVIIFLIVYKFFKNKFPKRTFYFCALAILSHLILDDLPYWLSLLGVEKNIRPQIFWFYPFDFRRRMEVAQIAVDYLNGRISNNKGIFLAYLMGAPFTAWLEITIFLTSVFFFVRQLVAEGRKKRKLTLFGFSFKKF